VNASTAVFTTLNPTQTLRMLLGSAQNAAPTTSGSLVRATTHLPTGAVDQALSEIDTLSLAASEVDSLTAGQSDSTGAVDAALLAL